MAEAQIGDLICWSAQSQWSPMRFGEVYRMRENVPYVTKMAKKDRRQEASTNYLIIARKGAQQPDGVIDSQINAALDWWYARN